MELRYHFQYDISIGKVSGDTEVVIPVACSINSVTIVIYDCSDNGVFVNMITIIIIII